MQVRENQLDVVLIAKSLRGDLAAKAELVRQYQKPVYNAAYRIIGNAEDAADITQTVFLKVFKNLEDYDSTFKFFSWIYRITVNESINLSKKQRPADELPRGQPSDWPDPEQRLVDKQRDASVQSALLELSPDYCSVVVLKYMMGLSYNEISTVLEVPVKTVKSRLYSGRQHLKDLLLESRPTMSGDLVT